LLQTRVVAGTHRDSFPRPLQLLPLKHAQTPRPLSLAVVGPLLPAHQHPGRHRTVHDLPSGSYPVRPQNSLLGMQFIWTTNRTSSSSRGAYWRLQDVMPMFTTCEAGIAPRFAVSPEISLDHRSLNAVWRRGRCSGVREAIQEAAANC